MGQRIAVHKRQRRGLQWGFLVQPRAQPRQQRFQPCQQQLRPRFRRPRALLPAQLNLGLLGLQRSEQQLREVPAGGVLQRADAVLP